MPKTYLPPHFHYDGMYKIKAGKGYLNQCTGETELFGIKGGPCKECDGTVISVKICTNARGFETTTEKVCDTCGLVVPGSFQILDKPDEDYSTKYYPTHEAWKEDNKPKGMPEDVDAFWENGVHLYGNRMGAVSDGGFTNNGTRNKRLRLAFSRLARTPQSMKISSSKRNIHQYHLIADDFIHELGMNKLDALDVHYHIDHMGDMFNTRYKMEDIIAHLCLVVLGFSTSRQRLGGIIKNRLSTIDYNKTLYSLIKDKLNNVKL